MSDEIFCIVHDIMLLLPAAHFTPFVSLSLLTSPNFDKDMQCVLNYTSDVIIVSDEKPFPCNCSIFEGHNVMMHSIRSFHLISCPNSLIHNYMCELLLENLGGHVPPVPPVPTCMGFRGVIEFSFKVSSVQKEDKDYSLK